MLFELFAVAFGVVGILVCVLGLISLALEDI